jgi:hypothetical protein
MIEMGKKIQPEYVSGENQLLQGRKCPRCFKAQSRVRLVRAFQSPRGMVLIYSCVNCKRPIATQIEEEENGREQAG